MTNEKILKSLKSATNYLKNSMTALKEKSESSFADSIWHVAAELEYALFLFSIIFQNESAMPNWKPNPEFKKIDTESVLSELQNLLNEAEKCVINGKLLEAYKNAYAARHYLLKVQEDISKKKREALKKK